MTQPRKALISLAETPYYHIVSRCVRRSYLCGADPVSGNSYEHRRQWIEDRIRFLSSLFAIDVAAYAVMTNHYHLVLKLCPQQLGEVSDYQVMDRWCSLFKGPLLVQRYRSGESLSTAERQTVSDIVNVWRSRLASISWFMKCLNQPIALQANKEDGCTGKFWESRFKSQALKTEEALISCMGYVDLNPVRAGIAETPETSDYTSIKERVTPTFDLAGAIQKQTDDGDLEGFGQPLKPLLHFEESIFSIEQEGIPCTFESYLELLDWTGRIVREDKRGAIPSHLPPILKRLNIPPKRWLGSVTQFEKHHRWRFNFRRKVKVAA